MSITPISGLKMVGQSAMRASPVSESILMPAAILERLQVSAGALLYPFSDISM